MAAPQLQPDSTALDVSVDAHLDVDVHVHNASDATSHDETHKPPQSDDEKKMEPQRQAWFENAIKDKLKIPNSYEEVSVLMIRWNPEIDEYRDGHDREIQDLKRVFQQGFGFSVGQVVCLDKGKAKPQNALNLAIAQHIANHDGANKLMIIYYTGHGALVGAERKLAFAATADAAKQLKNDPHAVAFWDVAERQLLEKGVEPDVLTILDCCFASSGHKGCTDSRRTYDLLAACDKDEETPAPGEFSFTQRLINTLERLLAEEGDQRILTTRLLEELNKDCEKPAHLFDRLKKNDGRHVQLKPVTRRSKRETKKLAIDFKKQAREEAGVNLRFSLQEKDLPRKKIEDWAQALVHACQSVDLPIRRIDWVKMEKNNPGQRLSSIVEIVTQNNKNSPKRRFQRAIESVIEDNRSAARKANKRNRSKDPSPLSPKRRASGKLLAPLIRTRSSSRPLTPESNVGDL